VLQKRHATLQNFLAAILAVRILQLMRHLEGIDAHLVRNNMLTPKPLDLSSGTPLQFAAHFFGSPSKGHRDIPVTDAEPIGEHISVVAQIKALQSLLPGHRFGIGSTFDGHGDVDYGVVLLVIRFKQLAHRYLDVIAHLHDNLLIGPPATGGRDLLMPV
jgi:hypothetical protein